MSGPSDKAVEAESYRSYVPGDPSSPAWQRVREIVENTPELPPSVHATRVVLATHNPALGLDRSVCLRDVVEALHQEANDHRESRTIAGPRVAAMADGAADFIEREFGGGE